jgi:hypothetical protein
MVNQQLINYINQNRNSYSVDQLKQALIQQGYSKEDVNQAADIATGKAPPLLNQQSTQVQGISPKFSSATKDPKFKETVKVFLIYGIVFGLIRYAISIISDGLTRSYWFGRSHLTSFIPHMLYVAIGAAIGGIVFYFIFDIIKGFVKKSGFLSKHMPDLFHLFWWPALVGFVISAIFTLIFSILLAPLFAGLSILAYGVGAGTVSFVMFIVAWFVSLIGNLIASYIYAKMISKKLGQYYPW